MNNRLKKTHNSLSVLNAHTDIADKRRIKASKFTEKDLH